MHRTFITPNIVAMFVESCLALCSLIPQDTTLQVSVDSNFLDLVIGTAVVVSDSNGQTTTKSTGRIGSTELMPVIQGESLSILIAEGVTTEGPTLSMARALALPSTATGDSHHVHFNTTVPLLQSVYIGPGDPPEPGDPQPELLTGESYLTTCTPEINGGTWQFLVRNDAPYGFSAQVAVLTDNSEIQAHFAARGLTEDISDYICGIVIRSEAKVSLGFEFPLYTEVWTPFHSFAGDVTADLFFAPGAGVSPDDYPIAASWGSEADDGFAYLDLFGEIGAGDTIVLLKEGVQNQASSVQYLEPTLSPDGASLPGGSGSGGSGVTGGGAIQVPDDDPPQPLILEGPLSLGASSSFSGPCTPPEPDMPDCTDPGPVGKKKKNNCPIAASITLNGAGLNLISCKKKATRLMNPKHGECLLPGNSATCGFTVTNSEKYGLQVSGGGSSASGGSSGYWGGSGWGEWGEEESEEISRTYNADLGENETGECFMQWQIKISCKFAYMRWKNRIVSEVREATGYCFGTEVVFWRTRGRVTILCADVENIVTACKSEFSDQTKCSRTE